MKRLDIKIGFQCNNRCVFCVQGDRRFHEPDKSKRSIQIILEKKAKDHDSVVFTGGEPTIRKELVGLVARAAKLGYQSIQVQTNGRMFAYKQYCLDLIRAGCTEFSPALHGSTPKIHDSLTRSPGSYLQTVQGVKNLKQLGQRVITNSVITGKNYKDLPNLARLFVNLGVDQFQFAFMHINSIIAHDPELVRAIAPRYRKVVPYIKKGIDIAAKAGIPVMAEAIPYCFMKGYEKYVSEQYIPSASVVDGSLELKDYGAYRKTVGKAKGPACPECIYHEICEGPWSEYPQIFGWSEFRPLKKQTLPVNKKS